VAIVHRLGRVPVGEASVAIAASAPHRGAAFDACRLAIDLLKQDVPIWKREVAPDGGGAWRDGVQKPA
jgi:molybdopterin synthase catalytic subunit